MENHGSGRRNGLPGRTKKLEVQLHRCDRQNGAGGRSASPGPPQPKRTTDVLRKPDIFKSYRQRRVGEGMGLLRRTFLRLAAGAAALPALVRRAAADYPTRPVHIVVGFPPGLATDIASRLIAQ